MLEHAEQTATKKGSALYSLPGVFGIVLLYSAFHITARLFASLNLGEDDPLDAILTQTLALGYYPGQPPLYDWLLWLLAQILGPGVLRFQLLKYGLLTATCGFVFMSARRVMKGDAVWALLSVEALALIYQISWRFHEGFTHAVGAMCAVAATFWALTRLAEYQRRSDYVLLGVCIGLGVLTVATYWVFLTALVGAAMFQPAIRRLITNQRIFLAMAVTIPIAAPYYVWLAYTPEGLGAMLPTMPTGSYSWRAVLEGFHRAITEPVMYLSPLIFLYPLFFQKFLPNLRAVRITPSKAAPDFEQLILHLTMLSFGALVLGALIYGINRYPVHALMPLFLITSIWLTAQARKAARSKAELRRFAIMALSVAIFAFFARAANMYVLEPVCKLCRWGIPYAELADEIRKAGFEKGQIVVYDAELGGNLARFFPEAVVALGGVKPYVPLFSKGFLFKDTIYVWDGKEKPDNAAQQFYMSGKVRNNAKKLALVLEKPFLISVPWKKHVWKPDGYRQSRWSFVIFHNGHWLVYKSYFE